MSEADKATIREYVAAAARQDWDRMDAIHAVGWRQHNPDGTEVRPDTYRGQIAAFFVGFPDLTPTIHDQVSEAGKVVTRLSWSGTHTGDFGGLPATGNHVAFEVVRIDAVANGRIVDTRVMFDSAALPRQLGT